MLPDQTYILECLNQAAPMLRNLAIAHNLEFEDLYQQSYLIAYDVLQRDTSSIVNLRAYIHSMIRYSVLDLARSGIKTMSLDTPFSEETDTSLADVLPAPEQIARDETDMDKKEQALYAALRSLPLEDQQYMRDRYGLQGFDVIPLYPYSLNNSHKTRNATRQHAYRGLRHDEQLREAMCQ
jgi:DNA-directed RNA polymerase specialized sigma24 family protein